MKQELKSELTKRTIVDAAFDLFYKNGYMSTSVNDVMHATTLSKGAFYHHFKNKQELGVAVITDKVQKRIYDGMIVPLFSEGDELQILNTVFADRMRSFSVYEKQKGCPANNLINEIGDVDEVYQVALKRIIEEWRSAIVNILERGKRSGTINKKVNSMSVAVYLISSFEGIRGIRKLYHNDEILDPYLLALRQYINALA